MAPMLLAAVLQPARHTLQIYFYGANKVEQLVIDTYTEIQLSYADTDA